MRRRNFQVQRDLRYLHALLRFTEIFAPTTVTAISTLMLAADAPNEQWPAAWEDKRCFAPVHVVATLPVHYTGTTQYR